VRRALKAISNLESADAFCLVWNDAPVGIVTLANDGDVAAYVAPGYQRRGLATIAVASMIRRAHEAGFVRVHVKARKGTGGAAVAAKAGLLPLREDGDEVFYEKRFDRAEQG
jgi:GNAT superfamily N-acetyltransferase